MDISKLPRMSDTASQQRELGEQPQPPNADALNPQQPPTAMRAAPAPEQPVSLGGGAEVWLSAILGFVFLLLGRSFGAYLLARMTGQVYHTGVNWTAGPLEGQEVAYPDLQGFVMLNDSAMFVFGLTLLMEAAVIAVVGTRFRYVRPLVQLALAVAAVATAYNAYACARLLGANVMPIFSLLAVAFGGYIAFYLWNVLKALPAGGLSSHAARDR